MEGLNFAPVLIPLVALFVGWVIGFFDSNLRTSKKIKEAETSAEVVIKEAKDKIAQAEAHLASIAATPVTVDDPGLLRIKNENGMLTLDLDGARVNTSLLSPDQRKRLIEMLSLMRPWLEGKPAPAMMTPPPPPIPPSAPIAPASPPLKPTPQSYDPLGQSKPAAPKGPTIAKDDRPSAPANSMVSQIDAILQSHLVGTPLEERGVFLTQSPEGGVNVYVGITRYAGIEDVPDAEIKAAIRAAISEWENKYTPGLK